MATTTTFDALLKRYMPNELLVEEMKRKNYFWNQVDKDSDWGGGTLEVAFEGGEYSSLSMGSLTGSTDISEATEVMGTLTTQPELWGTMIFNEKDLDRHDGDMEKSYLKIVPNKIDQFVTRMQERVSVMLLGDGSIAKCSAATNAGIATVDRPQFFTINEKVTFYDGSVTISGYVKAIDINTKKLTISSTRGGSVTDLSTLDQAGATKVYLPGSTTAGFSGLKAQLLSSANGGGSTIAGQTKASYPFLQATNIDGSGFTANTVLDDLLGAYYQHANLGKGHASEMLINYGVMKNVAKQLETNRRYTISDKKGGYGWSQIELMGPDGTIKLTAIRDMQTSEAYILDWDALTFYGSKFFERKRQMDGREAFLVRNTSGYQYIVDVKFYGDLLVKRPSHCGVVYGIPASVSA